MPFAAEKNETFITCLVHSGPGGGVNVVDGQERHDTESEAAVVHQRLHGHTHRVPHAVGLQCTQMAGWIYACSALYCIVQIHASSTCTRSHTDLLQQSELEELDGGTQLVSGSLSRQLIHRPRRPAIQPVTVPHLNIPRELEQDAANLILLASCGGITGID